MLSISLPKSASRPADKFVLWCVLGLSAIGVFAVYSAISFLAETKAGGNTERFLIGHVVRLLAALGVMGLFSLIDYHLLAKISRYALILSLVLLVAVRVVGVVSGGAARWLQVGSVGFQPSDFAKVTLLVYVALLLTRKQRYIKSFTNAFAPIFAWILVTVIAIGIEDLSTAALVLTAVLAMCFIARVSVLHLAGLGVVGLILAYGLLLVSPHRAARMESFLGMKIFPNTEAVDVFSDQAEGYQAKQALIAFARGGLYGVGPGKSVQKDFLPAPYNDYIYAIIAEEFGVVGAFILLALYIIILFRGMLRIARKAPDPLGFFLSVGLVTMLILYGFVHAAVTAGLLPVTGLPLPFVSYGGTSMMANGLMMGILLNVSRQVE